MAKIIIFISEILLVLDASIGLCVGFGWSAFIGSLFSLVCGIGLVMTKVKNDRFAIDNYYNMELPGKETLINIVANLLFACIAVMFSKAHWAIGFLFGWAVGYIVRIVFYYLARLIYKQFS